MSPIVINAVAFQEDGLWIAQCLEYDFVGCAETLDELPDEFLGQVTDQIEADLEAGHEPFFGFKPAPQRYWALFAAARAVSKPLKPRKDDLAHPQVQTQLFPVAA